MFRVKICGITQSSDAILAGESGADAIGLNFYPKSSRYVSMPVAAGIVSQLKPGVLKVGVFVNASAEEIIRTAVGVPLDVVQLHGDEPAQFLNELPPFPVIKAFRCGPAGLAPLIEFLAACKNLGRMPDALLIDAAVPGQYGGSGQRVDWSVLPASRELLGGLPVILAGGLNPENVAEAIRCSGPDGVDVASGVESSPGVKDVEKVRSFVSVANLAVQNIPRSKQIPSPPTPLPESGRGETYVC